MSILIGLRQFEKLAAAAGPSESLLLTAFYGQGSRSFYVPSEAIEGHPIDRLIGRQAFERLVAAFGGQTVSAPSLDCLQPIRHAGMISGLGRYGVPTVLMAAACDLTPRRVQQIRSQLALEGFPMLLEDEEVDHVQPD